MERYSLLMIRRINIVKIFVILNMLLLLMFWIPFLLNSYNCFPQLKFTMEFIHLLLSLHSYWVIWLSSRVLCLVPDFTQYKVGIIFHFYSGKALLLLSQASWHLLKIPSSILVLCYVPGSSCLGFFSLTYQIL